VIDIWSDPLPLDEWLAMLDQYHLTLIVPPFAQLKGGAFEGGYTVCVDGLPSGREVFMVPAMALRLIRDRIDPADYAALQLPEPVEQATTAD
jgi:hypothetical protein